MWVEFRDDINEIIRTQQTRFEICIKVFIRTSFSHTHFQFLQIDII